LTSQGTREALLDSAERLFALRGLYGVSLGEVGRQANQHNRSAAQYHFGSRDALIEAVAARHVETLNQKRWEMLRTLDLTGRGHDLRSLAEVFVIPSFRLLGHSGSYFRFMAQWTLLTLPPRALFELLEMPHADAFVELLTRLALLLPDLNPVVRRLRFRRAFTTTVQSLADYETTIELGEEFDERFAVIALVDLVVAMMSAPDNTPSAT
jgi:AcrR family transcriptional regulator